MKFFMISSRTDLFIHSNILQYCSTPHKQHTEKDFYRIFRQKKQKLTGHYPLQLLLLLIHFCQHFSKKAFIVPLIEIYSKRTDTNFYIIRLFCTFIIRRICCSLTCVCCRSCCCHKISACITGLSIIIHTNPSILAYTCTVQLSSGCHT